jgi:predicted HD superfamily hydrolase involved in NAD metabolism
MQGIPDNLSIAFAQKWMAARVSPKRLRHIEGVVRVSQRLAATFGCDPYLAQLAAWLHDACKGSTGEELVRQARAFNMPLLPIEEADGHILHGPVAACLVRSTLGIENADLLAAIAEHTLGAVPMCRLSELLFLADWLEENRPGKYTGPIWQALALDQQPDIEKAIIKATDLNLMHLMENGRLIHPRTIEVRNYYLERVRARPGRTEQGEAN